MEENLTIEELAEILNVKLVTIRVIIKNNKLRERLSKIGYELIDIIKENNKNIYKVIKVKEVDNTEIYKNEKGYYVDMTNCIKEGAKINWKKSIGKHITGCYKNIDFDFKIVDYDSKHNKLTVLLNGEEKELYYSDIKHFKGFDILFGIKSYGFKYEIGQRIVDYKDDGTIKRDFTIIDRKKGKDSTGHSWKYYKVKCNKCGFDGGEHYYNGEYKKEYWIKEAQINNKNGLGCCSSQFCVKGINDMWTTNPDIAELLSNKEDGYKYTMGTGTKLYFKCPYCGRDNLIQPVNVKKFNKVNCTCSDGVSYPEKFMASLLEQLNIEFIKEIKFDWCKFIFKDKETFGRYDFYIPSKQLIIEMDGGFHNQNNSLNGKTVQDSKYLDKIKDELAIQHNLKIIRINCDYPCISKRFKFIKENTIKELNNIFALSNVDWEKCNEYTYKNLYKEICDYWNNKKDKKSIKIVAKELSLGTTQVSNALKIGNELGWCEYSKKVNYKNDIYIKVTDLEDNLLGVYRGYRDLQDNSLNQFGEYLDHKKLFTILNQQKIKEYGNMKFYFSTSECYENNLNNRVKYKFKNKYIKMIYDNNTYYFKNATRCAEYINKTFGRNTSSSTVSNKCKEIGKLYDYNLSFIYLSKEQYYNYKNK